MFFITSLFLVLLSGSVYAGLGTQDKTIDLKSSSSLQAITKPEKKIKSIRRTTSHKASINTDLLKVCNVCHSKRAYENNSFLPILAGQNQSYLHSKITLFRNDKRNFHPFSKQLSKLTENDIDDLSYFYADQSSPLDAALILKDLKLSQSEDKNATQCLSCHGLDGNGDELIPIISGQNTRYLSYRIREINNKSSNIHTAKNLDINCQISRIALLQSNQLSRLLSYSATSNELKKGESIYQKRCSSCHNGFAIDVLALQKDLSKSSLKQQRKHYYYHSKIKAVKGNHSTLSPQSWSIALLYMLSNIVE